jgi:RNA polymerase sigma factor (sigma-70 family)
VDEDERARRWALVVPHRERLLGIARRLVRDPGDAEACVQEAMLRCVTFPRLDESNVAGFLVVTTRRLCVDHHRLHARDGHVSARLTGMTTPEPTFDDAVCDRAEAAWVTARLADLPDRQRAVVRARSDGRSPREIAEYLSVSYKTVETLLYRARTRARAELDRAYGVLALLALRRPRAGGNTAATAGAASLALVASTSLLFGSPPAARHEVAAPRAVVVERAAPPAARPAPAPAPSRAPAPLPTPTPVPSLSPPPTPRPPHATLPPARCPAPPYWAQPCVNPNTDDPTSEPVPLLACVKYGFDFDTGFVCRTAPSPTPTPTDTEGAPR